MTMREAVLTIAIAAAIHRSPGETRRAAIRVRRRVEVKHRRVLELIIDARDPVAVINRTVEDLGL